MDMQKKGNEMKNGYRDSSDTILSYYYVKVNYNEGKNLSSIHPFNEGRGAKLIG